MYHLLKYAYHLSKDGVRLFGSIYDQNQKTVKWIFNKGNPIDTNSDSSRFAIILNEEESRYRNLVLTDKIQVAAATTGSLFVVSKACAQVLVDSGVDNLQFLDIEIKGAGINLTDYKIVNILDSIACIDRENSDIDLYPDGKIRNIESLALIESEIPPQKKIFLLKEAPASKMVVSNDFIEIIHKNKLSGFEFLDLEETDMYC